jgi:hypothetical protein
MMMRTIIRSLAIAAAIGLAAPATAFAQRASEVQDGARAHAPWFVSPLVGAAFGDDARHTSGTVGIAGGWLGRGWLSWEAELADSPYLVPQGGFLISRRVTTLIGSAVIGMPARTAALRPYGVVGLGLLRPRFAEAGDLAAVTGNRLGFAIGGGVTSWANEHLGGRGDIRYFRGLRSEDGDETNSLGIDISRFGFWRVSGGLMVRF